MTKDYKKLAIEAFKLNLKIKQNFIILFNALQWYILEDLLPYYLH